MRRIWFIWSIRQVLNPVFLKVLIVAVFLFESRDHVYYAQVFRNAPALSDVFHNVAFYWSAAVHTDIVTLSLVGGATLVGGWLCADIIRKKTEAYI